MLQMKAQSLKLCNRIVSTSCMVRLSVKCAKFAVALAHKAPTTDVAAFSSMVVVGVSSAGLLRLKIPMMSYYARSGIAKSRTEDGIIV